MSRTNQSAPGECAQCGAAIPLRARACPECGADERTGWRETSIYDGLDLPEDADKSEGRSAQRAVGGLAWYWWALGVMLLFTLGFAALGLLP
jgi:hypothetical protein